MSEDLEEPELTLARSMSELELKQNTNSSLWGFGRMDRWDANLETGVVTFSSPNLIATAPVQVIGTFNSKDNTWLWGWDHPSVPEPLAEAARQCRDFGLRYRLTEFMERKVQCSQSDAWRFTALALHLSAGTGSYRGPAGTTYVFMTFGDVTLSKPS